VQLSDLAQFAEFNASYANQFPGPVKPVRTTVGSDLAAGMRVGVTVVARRPAAAVWIGLLCAGCLGAIAVGARLRRALTSDQDYVTEAPATESEPVAAVRDE
jgi:hypothetical protein